MRLNELSSIKASDIDWDKHVITIWGKGNKQRKAPFTERSAKLLHDLVSQNDTGDNIWHMKPRGVQNMLLELAKKTGLPYNPHNFRRTFASNFHRAGLDIEHIMRLGGWECKLSLLSEAVPGRMAILSPLMVSGGMNYLTERSLLPWKRLKY
jgi:integrase